MTLEDYAFIVSGRKCIGCKKPFPLPIKIARDNSGPDGWEVEGFSERQWLSVTCSCGYQNALWKLGIIGIASLNPVHERTAIERALEYIILPD